MRQYTASLSVPMASLRVLSASLIVRAPSLMVLGRFVDGVAAAPRATPLAPD
ncbi:MAG TPA: hypothetical protein VKE96_27545 [Vicinamibacterales bacterium]|nr:hypothetical protein [Vicinamibacterales bacterium]